MPHWKVSPATIEEHRIEAHESLSPPLIDFEREHQRHPLYIALQQERAAHRETRALLQRSSTNK